MALPTGALVHNWKLKLTALGLAVMLWAVAQSDRNSETVPAVPILVEMSDTLWTPAGPPDPAVVELRLSGPAREIIRLAREGTRVRVPIDAVGGSDTIVSLRRDWVMLGDGNGLTVESMSPASVRISFESAETELLPIAIRTRGSLPGHLALASPIGVSPTTVRVRGPASRIEGLDSVPLRPFDLAGVSASGVFEIPIDTSAVGGVRVVPPAATLGIRVEEEIERILEAVPILASADGDEAAVVVSPTAVDVTLRGARTLVMAVESSDVRAWIEPEFLRGMAPGDERRVPVRVGGVPALVRATVPNDLVTARRTAPTDGTTAPGGGP